MIRIENLHRVIRDVMRTAWCGPGSVREELVGGGPTTPSWQRAYLEELEQLMTD